VILEFPTRRRDRLPHLQKRIADFVRSEMGFTLRLVLHLSLLEAVLLLPRELRVSLPSVRKLPKQPL
jgi:hypothetical protein